MKNQDERIANMSFASVYPHYINKIEKKNRSKQELHEVISWLTGYNDQQIQEHIDNNSSFKEFFEDANLNPNAQLIKGVICGYRVEEIENTLT